MGNTIVMLMLSAAMSFATSTQTDLQRQQAYYDDLELMAMCVEAEAGNQGFMGKQLVADVILNRVESDRFPDTIEGVIKQRFAFSSYGDGRMQNIVPSEETYQACRAELGSRINREVLFFTYEEYNKYCIPMFKYRDHYFGR
jgi:N-acetylmuramoyl-L-alanine amidase